MIVDWRIKYIYAPETKCILLDILLFQSLFHDTNHGFSDLWYSLLSSRFTNRASFNLKHYEWFMQNVTLDNRDTIHCDFLKDLFARMQWLVSTFERTPRQLYKHVKFVLIDEALRIFITPIAVTLKHICQINQDNMELYFVAYLIRAISMF